MLERWRKIVAFFTDTTTVAERWLLAFALLVVVMGALVKHLRTRPQQLPPLSTVPVSEP